MLQAPSLTTKSLGVRPWTRLTLSPRRRAPQAFTDDAVDQAAAAARREARFQRVKEATQASYLLNDGRWFP